MTLRLGRSRSGGSGLSERQYWMPCPDGADLLFGVLRFAPMPKEFLRADPPRVILHPCFMCPFLAPPHVTAFALGQAGFQTGTRAVGHEGLEIEVRALSTPLSREIAFGWIAVGRLSRLPDMEPRDGLGFGVIAEWDFLESLFGAPTPAGASADAACGMSTNGAGTAASADDSPSLRLLRPGAHARLGDRWIGDGLP